MAGIPDLDVWFQARHLALMREIERQRQLTGIQANTIAALKSKIAGLELEILRAQARLHELTGEAGAL